MTNNCINVFTHKDLDGAVSLLTLMWALPDSCINYKAINNMEIAKLKTYIQEVNKPWKTFILDMALREEFLPELDQEHITFIDHHESSVAFLDRFSKAKIDHQIISSNSLLLAKKFLPANGPYPSRTEAQKMLIALADDYDCYRLKIPESYDLNLLFWSEYKNNFNKFISDYKEGFKTFSDQQKKAINFLKKEAIEEADNLKLYSGQVNFGERKKKVLAILAEKFSNPVVDILMKRHQPDIFFFINPKTEKVSVRQNTKENPINVGSFMEKICEGGGHQHAGGGIITPLFMEVTKNLNPV